MMSYDNIVYNTETYTGSTIMRAIEFRPAPRRAESIPKNATEVTKVVLISNKVYALRNTDRKA
jgi:hypothetical protein